MAPDRSPIRLTTPPLLLALVLILGSATPAIARDTSTLRSHLMGGSATRLAPPPASAGKRQVQPEAEAPIEVRPPTPDIPAAKAASVPIPISPAVPAATTAKIAASLEGSNHVWIPSLGVSRSITSFPCTSKAYPGDRVYRWGCAGSNNIYLFGHAQSVFEPLHDAYVSGHLRKGMALYYAGDDGTVHTYTVRWWKVTTPDKGEWAFASQSRPSLTLQTCVGASSQFRLVVRLVQTD